MQKNVFVSENICPLEKICLNLPLGIKDSTASPNNESFHVMAVSLEAATSAIVGDTVNPRFFSPPCKPSLCREMNFPSSTVIQSNNS